MANTYLTRTPSSAGNRRTFTISTWVKRSSIASGSKTIFGIGNSSSSTSDADWFSLAFNGSTNRIRSVQYNTVIFDSNRVFRDTSAWYHIVYAVDTTQGTASDRVKVYINGVQETSFATVNYPSQNYDFVVNTTVPHMIGREDGNGSGYFDGLMSYVAVVDGTAELPTIFGETDSVTGQWKIKTNITPSVAWGTNGFLILKNGNSLTDESTNSNNFTLGGGTLTNTLDCPDNVFATWNPLGALSTPPTFSNGNTTAAVPTSGGAFRSTLAASSGKYYCEVKVTTLENFAVGIQPIDSAYNVSIFGDTSGIGLYGTNGEVYKNGSNIGAVASVSNNDIIGMAIDLDNNNIYFSVNGQYASGLSGSWNQSFGSAYAVAINSGHTYTIAGVNGSSGTTSNISINFGNGYFGTTAVSSAGTNASGNGIFEYDVPTGFTALSTKGLNL